MFSIIICIIQYVYYYVLLSVCCWYSVSVSEIVRTLYGKVSKSCVVQVHPCISALCDNTKGTEAFLIPQIVV